MSKLQVEMVRKANASESKLFSPIAIASDGEKLFVNSRFRFYVGDDAEHLSDVRKGDHISNLARGLLLTNEALWAFGDNGIARSVDRGASFKPVSPECYDVGGMALDPNGVLWAGDGEGAILTKTAGAKAFSRVANARAAVTAIAPSRLGVLIGDADGGLSIGKNGKLTATALQAGEPVRAILETEEGTLLVISGAEFNAKPSIARSTDGGKSFKKTACKASLLVLAQAPGGPIVAGGWNGALAASFDDGRTFDAIRHTAADKKQKFQTACVQRGQLLVSGDFQNLVAITTETTTSAKKIATKKVATKPVPKGLTPAPKKGGAKGYVSNGTFQADIEAVFGKLKKRGKAAKRGRGVDEAVASLPAQLATEVTALLDLYSTYTVPRLCGLRTGGFVSIPSQYGLDAAGVRDDEWFTKAADIDLVTSSIEIYEDQGSPFVIVGKRGVALFFEDPYGYVMVAKELESFLRALVAVEGAARGKVPVKEARRILKANIAKVGQSQQFFERTLEDAEDRQANE